MNSEPCVTDRALQRSTGAPLIGGNQVDLLCDGPETFASWLRDIAAARRFIHLENYIFNSDHIGFQIAEALMERARAGVRVRLLYDWVGCLGTSRVLWRRLQAAGVEVRPFGVVSVADPVEGLRRNHRKTLCIDGEVGHVGGLCVGDSWAGDAALRIPPWRDTEVRFTGPAAAALCQAFSETWSRGRADEALGPEELRPPPAPARGPAALRVISGEPGRSRTYRTLHLLISSAHSRVWITDAYFLTPPPLYEALIAAARDGVDVRVLVPGRSDLPWVNFFGRAGFQGLLEAGVRVYEWEGPMLHAKTVVVDSRFSRVGSSNLNLASLLTNWELDVLVEDRTLAKRMEQVFLRDLTNSSELVLYRRRRRRRITRVPPPLRPAPPGGAGDEAVALLPPRRRRPPAVLGKKARARAVVARAGAAMLGVALRQRVERRAWMVSAVTAALLLVLGGLGVWRPHALGLLIGALLLWLGVGSARGALRQLLEARRRRLRGAPLTVGDAREDADAPVLPS